ncbi:MAG: ATP-binding protein [Planctomycetota bacterium]
MTGDNSEMTPDDRRRLGLLAGQAFTPGPPVRGAEEFAGRDDQLQQVSDAIGTPGRSVLIYGERGVGKTSLANVIDELYRQISGERICSPSISCDSDDTFDSIWKRVFRAAASTVEEPLSERVTHQLHDALDVAISLTSHDVCRLATIVTQAHLFIPVIDELDRVPNTHVLTVMTDTIKQLSDHVPSATVVLVGVADEVDELLAAHKSIERAIEQVLMPRMPPDETLEILAKGAAITGIEFEPDASSLITKIAMGLPHHAHLLGLNATRAALEAGSSCVRADDVHLGLDRAIKGRQHTLMKAYDDATTSPRPDNLYRQALLACALAETDQLGYFTAAGVRDPMTAIMGEPYDIPNYTQHLAQFCEQGRGPVLHRIGAKRRYRYRFANALLQPFVVMHGLKEGWISEEDLRG